MANQQKKKIENRGIHGHEGVSMNPRKSEKKKDFTKNQQVEPIPQKQQTTSDNGSSLVVFGASGSTPDAPSTLVVERLESSNINNNNNNNNSVESCKITSSSSSSSSSSWSLALLNKDKIDSRVTQEFENIVDTNTMIPLVPFPISSCWSVNTENFGLHCGDGAGGGGGGGGGRGGSS